MNKSYKTFGKIDVLGAPETTLNFIIVYTFDMQPSIYDTTKVLYVLRFRALRIYC